MFVDDGDGREDGNGSYQKEGSDAHSGTVYTVAGSSGKISSGSLDHPVMYKSMKVLGSVVLDIDGTRLDATFLDDSGDVRDYYTVQKSGGTPLEIPTAPTNLHVN